MKWLLLVSFCVGLALAGMPPRRLEREIGLGGGSSGSGSSGSGSGEHTHKHHNHGSKQVAELRKHIVLHTLGKAFHHAMATRLNGVAKAKWRSYLRLKRKAAELSLAARVSRRLSRFWRRSYRKHKTKAELLAQKSALLALLAKHHAKLARLALKAMRHDKGVNHVDAVRTKKYHALAVKYAKLAAKYKRLARAALRRETRENKEYKRSASKAKKDRAKSLKAAKAKLRSLYWVAKSKKLAKAHHKKFLRASAGARRLARKARHEFREFKEAFARAFRSALLSKHHKHLLAHAKKALKHLLAYHRLTKAYKAAMKKGKKELAKKLKASAAKHHKLAHKHMKAHHKLRQKKHSAKAIKAAVKKAIHKHMQKHKHGKPGKGKHGKHGKKKPAPKKGAPKKPAPKKKPEPKKGGKKPQKGEHPVAFENAVVDAVPVTHTGSLVLLWLGLAVICFAGLGVGYRYFQQRSKQSRREEYLTIDQMRTQDAVTVDDAEHEAARARLKYGAVYF